MKRLTRIQNASYFASERASAKRLLQQRDLAIQPAILTRGSLRIPGHEQNLNRGAMSLNLIEDVHAAHTTRKDHIRKQHGNVRISLQLIKG